MKQTSGTSDSEELVDVDIWDSSGPDPAPDWAITSSTSTKFTGALESVSQETDPAASVSAPGSSPVSAPGNQTYLGTGPVPLGPQASSVVARSTDTQAAPSPHGPSAPSSEAVTTNEVRTPYPRGVLAPGEQFGVYRVGPCIGEGGMARIYQAEHAGLRRQVALKVLLDGSTRAPEGRERFLREARIAAAIKHPNVVNIFDVGVHEDTAFLVMELLTGTDLEQLIQARGALDEGTIVDIMIPVLAGLTAVHDAGVVHRDLKPGNVFLAQGRYDEVDPKLLDFGISKAPGPEQLRLTANGMLIGTPFYMSPEGLRGEEMTPKSDQYSLGVVMYECATGTNPFGATTFAEIFRLIGAGKYPPPSTARPQISKRMERIIMRAMSLDPAERFKDLREMGRELLLLAGQRTRITWSLSFGELDRPKFSGTDTWQVPDRSAAQPLPPEKLGSKWKRGLLLAPLLLAIVLGLGWAGAFPKQEEPGSATLHAAKTAATVQPAPVAEVVRSPDPSVNVVLPSSAAVSAEAPLPVPRGPQHTSRAAPRRRVASSSPPPEKTEQEPDWALPGPASATSTSTAQTKSGQARSQAGVGANGAPIFD